MVHCRTDDGKVFQTLNILDAFGRECLTIRGRRKLNAMEVIDALGPARLAFIRSGNGPEFVALAVRGGIAAVREKTACIAPGSSWGHGYCESINARFRDAMRNGEVFCSSREAQILSEQWTTHYNTQRSHSALRDRPPAPEAITAMDHRLVIHELSKRTTHVGPVSYEQQIRVKANRLLTLRPPDGEISGRCHGDGLADRARISQETRCCKNPCQGLQNFASRYDGGAHAVSPNSGHGLRRGALASGNREVVSDSA